MKAPYVAALAAILAAGCFPAVRPIVPGPLDTEGELYLEAQPLPQGARLAFRIASIAAVRHDGSETPLTVVRPSISAAELKDRRLLAWGRLEPGAYTGFSIKVSKATLTGEAGTSDLLVSPEPTRTETPFTVERRHATVLHLDLDYPASIDREFGFEPVFSASVPRKPLVQVSGWCSNSGLHDLTVFDRREHAVSAILPTGRAPWGIAYDPVLNRLYVSLEGEDEIQVLDAMMLEEVGRIRLQPADGPRELALTPDRRLLIVANGRSNTVSFVDPAAMLESSRVPVGEAPTSILLDRTGARAYVFNARSTFISILDVPTRAAAGTIATEYGPLRGQLNRAGNKLYVVTSSSAYLSAISLPTFAQAGRVYVGLGTTAIQVDPATDLLYVAQAGANRLAVFEPFSLLPIDHIDIPGDASYMAIDDAENALFVLVPGQRTIAVIGLATKRRLGQVDVGFEPRVVALAGERR
jgi:YVTN family beta-propeller protein